MGILLSRVLIKEYIISVRQACKSLFKCVVDICFVQRPPGIENHEFISTENVNFNLCNFENVLHVNGKCPGHDVKGLNY